MLSDPKIWLGFILGVIGSSIGAFFSHIFASRRDRNALIRNAVIDYRKVFAPQIYAISSKKFGMDTFSNSFDNHRLAVENTLPFLNCKYQAVLQNAWEKYCGKDYKDTGFEGKDFIAMSSATFVNGEDAMLKGEFDKFKKRFDNLHSCLDKLL